jgi:mannose-6-phosphate isomerase-like protein (cupin superfamily)
MAQITRLRPQDEEAVTSAYHAIHPWYFPSRQRRLNMMQIADSSTRETTSMTRQSIRLRVAAATPTLMALALGTGWAFREVAQARERVGVLTSRTINLSEVKMSAFKDQDKPVGQIGLYAQGETPGCASFVTGRFVIDPGKSPHAPHAHDDEEVLIVESGRGEIICDGKTTQVGPGSVMYSTPSAAHGITNTGTEPLTFYFVKWIPRGSIQAK